MNIWWLPSTVLSTFDFPVSRGGRKMGSMLWFGRGKRQSEHVMKSFIPIYSFVRSFRGSWIPAVMERSILCRIACVPNPFFFSTCFTHASFFLCIHSPTYLPTLFPRLLRPGSHELRLKLPWLSQSSFILYLAGSCAPFDRRYQSRQVR